MAFAIEDNYFYSIYGPKNNKITKYLLKQGYSLEDALYLSFIVTIEIWTNII